MPLWVAWILLPLTARAQSGDVEPSLQDSRNVIRDDSERTFFCTSHISIVLSDNSLTCNLVEVQQYNEDDEDQGDRIVNIKVCSHCPREKCHFKVGNTIILPMLPLCPFDVTVCLARGDNLTRRVDLRQIVKPRSPSVRNATFDPQKIEALIKIETPYRADYLTAHNQLFQFEIRSTPEDVMTLNMTGIEPLIIPSSYLKENASYRVKVRAIPMQPFEGTWSDWGSAVEFYANFTTPRHVPVNEGSLTWMFIVIPWILVVYVVYSIFVRRKTIHQSIRTYISPKFPTTLVPMYKQVKLSFAMSFEPEQFSLMNVQPMKKPEDRPSGQSQATSADGAAQRRDGDPGSGLGPLTPGMRGGGSTGDTGIFTGESASTLLTGSSAGETGSRPYSRSPSPLMVSPAAEGGPNRPRQPGRDVVYVTLSSFYRSKDQRSQ